MLFLSVLLFGCPLPPSETTNDNPKVNVQGNAPQQNGGAPGANPGAGGKPPGAPANVGGEMQGTPGGQGGPAGKPGGVLMDMEQMKAQQSQAQIDTIEHVTISGKIDGECTGVLRLDAIGTEDGGPQDGGR